MRFTVVIPTHNHASLLVEDLTLVRAPDPSR